MNIDHELAVSAILLDAENLPTKGLTPADQVKLEKLKAGVKNEKALPSQKAVAVRGTSGPGGDDSLLVALDYLRERRDAYDEDIRAVVAYAQSLGRTYSLGDLAKALDMSRSGVRTLVHDDDIARAERAAQVARRVIAS